MPGVGKERTTETVWHEFTVYDYAHLSGLTCLHTVVCLPKLQYKLKVCMVIVNEN